jgi:hypothetical protein
VSAARLITPPAPARTPTSELMDLRRLASTVPRSLGHFVPADAVRTLCGIELLAPQPVATVRCPICLALAMPGLPGEPEGRE